MTSCNGEIQDGGPHWNVYNFKKRIQTYTNSHTKNKTLMSRDFERESNMIMIFFDFNFTLNF